MVQKVVEWLVVLGLYLPPNSGILPITKAKMISFGLKTIVSTMNFEEYLLGKKIDPAAFRQHEAERFQEWQNLYEQLHPESFTAQKKFLINEIRRKYLLPARV
jgi:hypothetical protein